MVPRVPYGKKRILFDFSVLRALPTQGLAQSGLAWSGYCFRAPTLRAPTTSPSPTSSHFRGPCPTQDSPDLGGCCDCAWVRVCVCVSGWSSRTVSMGRILVLHNCGAEIGVLTGWTPHAARRKTHRVSVDFSIVGESRGAIFWASRGVPFWSLSFWLVSLFLFLFLFSFCSFSGVVKFFWASVASRFLVTFLIKKWNVQLVSGGTPLKPFFFSSQLILGRTKIETVFIRITIIIFDAIFIVSLCSIFVLFNLPKWKFVLYSFQKMQLQLFWMLPWK